MTIHKADELDANFQHKSDKAKDMRICRFLALHELAIGGEILVLLPKQQEMVVETGSPAQQTGGAKFFHAKQIFVDDVNSPVLPPDFQVGEKFTCAEKARQKYRELRGNNMRKCNQYVPGALYKDLFEGSFLVLDHDDEGDFDISIEYTPSAKSVGNTVATTWVKVRHVSTLSIFFPC